MRYETLAVMMGMLAGLHEQAKLLEAEVPEMDMVCCQLEDVFATLEPLLRPSIHPAEALATNC